MHFQVSANGRYICKMPVFTNEAEDDKTLCIWEALLDKRWLNKENI